MLAAWELGIGSCHGSSHDEPRIHDLLGYPHVGPGRVLRLPGRPRVPGAGRLPLGAQTAPELRHEERFGG